MTTYCFELKRVKPGKMRELFVLHMIIFEISKWSNSKLKSRLSADITGYALAEIDPVDFWCDKFDVLMQS